MSIFKRILLYAGMVISVIVMILFLAGIIGTWAINKPVTETIVKVLEPINSTLVRVESLSSQSATRLGEVSTAIEGVSARVEEKGAEITETSIILELVSTLTGEDVRPKIENARDGIRSVYDTLVAIEEVIHSLNGIPFVGIEVPGSEQVAQLRTGMEEAAAGTQEIIDQSQQMKEETVAGAVERVTGSLDQINAKVEGAETRINAVVEQANASSEQITTLQERIPLWIDILCIVVSLFLAWIIFSQVAVFVLCLKYLQDKIA